MDRNLPEYEFEYEVLMSRWGLRILFTDQGSTPAPSGWDSNTQPLGCRLPNSIRAQDGSQKLMGLFSHKTITQVTVQ